MSGSIVCTNLGLVSMSILFLHGFISSAQFSPPNLNEDLGLLETRVLHRDHSACLSNTTHFVHNNYNLLRFTATTDSKKITQDLTQRSHPGQMVSEVETRPILSRIRRLRRLRYSHYIDFTSLSQPILNEITQDISTVLLD